MYLVLELWLIFWIRMDNSERKDILKLNGITVTKPRMRFLKILEDLSGPISVQQIFKNYNDQFALSTLYRVVNDLEVPKTSFKATDIIAVANPVKTADGLSSWKRVLQITEVRKHWTNDPMEERGFVDLMRYDTKKDELIPTADLLNGESEVVKSIAGSVREWVGNWDAVWENILLRSKIKQTLVDYARKTNNQEIIESNFVVASNDMFHRLIEQVRGEVGSIDSNRVFHEWDDWVRKSIKSKKNRV